MIIWSFANESDFEKTYAFRAEYNFVKKIDITRPVIFSYDGSFCLQITAGKYYPDLEWGNYLGGKSCRFKDRI